MSLFVTFSTLDEYLMDDNEPDDVEYNFLTEEEPEEVEEFRNDKAVRISRTFN